MSRSDVVVRARNEVREEETKAAVGKLKVLYRDELAAEKVLAAIKRKIAIEEDKVNDA